MRRTEKRYYVTVKQWDYDEQVIVRMLLGTFDRYADAELFRTAYNNKYSARAEIWSESELLDLIYD